MYKKNSQIVLIPVLQQYENIILIHLKYSLNRFTRQAKIILQQITIYEYHFVQKTYNIDNFNQLKNYFVSLLKQQIEMFLKNKFHFMKETKIKGNTYYFM